MAWIRVCDKLPNHNETVLVVAEKGQAVCIFVDGDILKRVLGSVGVTAQKDNDKYFFCSQEIKGAFLNKVTHWQPLPTPPQDPIDIAEAMNYRPEY